MAHCQDVKSRCRGVGRPEIRGVCEEENFGKSRVSISNGCTICLTREQVKTQNENGLDPATHGYAVKSCGAGAGAYLDCGLIGVILCKTVGYSLTQPASGVC